MPVWAWILVGLTAAWLVFQVVILVVVFRVFFRELTRR